MNAGLVAILELFCFTIISECVDWCQRDCFWSDQKHLRCIFEERRSNSLCTTIESVIKPRERKYILHYHNVLRNDVARAANSWKVAADGNIKAWKMAAPAGDMRQIVWDYDLEKNAEIYATQCNVRTHKPYDCAQPDSFPIVHMNKWDSVRSRLTMDETFKDFVRGVKFVNLFYAESLLVRKYFPGPWDEFFAVIYAPTYAMGCAKALCHCNQEHLGTSGTVVCLYGPAPNLSSEAYPIYRTGKPCSECPPDTWCKNTSIYTSLCARKGDPENIYDIPGENCATSLLFRLFQLIFVMIQLGI